MMETLIKKQSIKNQMLRWSFLSLAGIGILTSCNKEEIKKQENVVSAPVEQQLPTKFKVHFEGEVLTLQVKDIQNYDFTFKELNHPVINQLAANHSLHTVPGFPDEKGNMSTDLYVFRSQAQVDSKIEEMSNLEMNKFGSIFPTHYRCYENTNYGGNSYTVNLYDSQASSYSRVWFPDLKPYNASSRVGSYKQIITTYNNPGQVRSLYFFNDVIHWDFSNGNIIEWNLIGRVFRVGLPNITNASSVGLQNKKYISGSELSYDAYW